VLHYELVVSIGFCFVGSGKHLFDSDLYSCHLNPDKFLTDKSSVGRLFYLSTVQVVKKFLLNVD